MATGSVRQRFTRAAASGIGAAVVGFVILHVSFYAHRSLGLALAGAAIIFVPVFVLGWFGLVQPIGGSAGKDPGTRPPGSGAAEAGAAGPGAPDGQGTRPETRR